MKKARVSLFLLIILSIGIFIGTLGWEVSILIIFPVFLLWFMSWDEQRYQDFRGKKQQNNTHYAYHK